VRAVRAADFEELSRRRNQRLEDVLSNIKKNFLKEQMFKKNFED